MQRAYCALCRALDRQITVVHVMAASGAIVIGLCAASSTVRHLFGFGILLAIGLSLLYLFGDFILGLLLQLLGDRLYRALRGVERALWETG